MADAARWLRTVGRRLERAESQANEEAHGCALLGSVVSAIASEHPGGSSERTEQREAEGEVCHGSRLPRRQFRAIGTG